MRVVNSGFSVTRGTGQGEEIDKSADVRSAESTQAQTAPDAPANSVAEAGSESGAAAAAAMRMESDLSGAAMRAMLTPASSGPAGDSAMPADVAVYGSGGITHQPPVANPLGGEGYSSQVKKELTDGLRTVYQSPEFKSLGPAEQTSVLHALASNPPLTAEKIAKTLDLLGAANQSLTPADRKLVVSGFRASHAGTTYAANLKKLIDDPKFKSLTSDEKTAVLSQTRNYPDARSVDSIQRMLQKDWFTAQDSGDKQRSLKTIARLAQQPPQGDQRVIDNTLNKVIGPNSDFKLEWKNYPPGQGYYGEGGHKTLYLNRGLILADNSKMIENEDTDHLTRHTVAHEVNHLVNDDKVANTFQYLEAEYRAWYAGFQSEHGRVPTNEEAMQQRIAFQLDPDNFYGKHAAEAMKDPAEAQKIYDLLGKITGQKVDATNWQNVIKSDPATWPNLSLSPAPVPGGNVDNH